MKHWTYAVEDVLYMRGSPTLPCEYDGQPCIVYARTDGTINPETDEPIDTDGGAYVVEFRDGARVIVLEYEVHPLGRRTWLQ